jgi:Zn-dependent peptidase ImmA (M78 family)
MKAQEFLIEGVASDFIQAFLPMVKKHLNLNSLPTIRVVAQVPDTDGTTFGRYDNVDNIIYLVAQGRHPKDTLRTLAHELVHYQQGQQNRLKPDSGETGSTEENEANALAGVLMRRYSEANPE